MAEYDRYINLPGFDNVNRALTLFNVPVDLYRQGDGSVDAIANPDNLPMRERIGRGIESLVGTAAYALTPLFARFGGQKAAQAIPEIFTGFSGSQAADEVVKDVVQDPSRRDFLKGAAATAGIATVAPSVITDVATQVAKRGPGAPRTSIFTSAAANIRELKRQIQDLQELKDDIDYRDNPNETPELTKELEEQYVQAGRDQDLNETLLKDEYEQVFEMLNDDPVLIKNAPDDDLEFVLENVYEDNVDIYDVVKNLNLENDMSDVIADEIKTRKLHLQKDKNGVDKYPYARLFLEDYQEINLGPISMPDPSMQMARETPSDLTEEMRQMRIRSADRIYKEKVEELREFTDFAEEKIQDIAERARQEELRRKADGGSVQGIGSLSDTARDMYRGPRGIGAYQQFTQGGAATSSDILNLLMTQSAQAEAEREEKNKAIALAEQRQKFADEEEVMSQPLDNSLASTYARAAKMGEDEFMVGVAPTNINPMYQLAMKGDPRGIFGVLPPRDETIKFNPDPFSRFNPFGPVELAGYDNRSMKDVAAGQQRFLMAQAIPDFKNREELRAMIPFFAKDLTDEERQQLKRPILADPMMATKEILAHEAGHLYDDEFFKENMDVIYPLYEELLDGYGRKYGDGFVGEFLQELFEPVEASEQFTEMGVTDEMRQAAQDYLRRGALDTEVLSPATIGVLARLKRLMNEDSKLTTALRPRPRPSQLN